MLLFCPNCSNVLTVSSKAVPSAPAPGPSDNGRQPQTTEMSNVLECQTCPYEYALTQKIYERKTYARREREDVFGGPQEWDNAQKGTVQCPKEACVGNEAAFYMVQVRSADEPMTGFYKCMTCGHSWREN